ncbi:hypothetical protein DFH06DRAFT_1150311 [Mycena polygramma]|nr:hypothetical protein DFH06DRAFT_1150311 [Mycena polygramma]
MAHLTTALLGSFSRLFSPSPDALSHSKSDSDLAHHMDTHLRPASSTGVHPRPASAMAIDGYWGWDVGGQGMTLRKRTCHAQHDLGLKAPADVKITDSSPVLCQPPRPLRTGTPFPFANVPAQAAAAAYVGNARVERPDSTASGYTLDRRADSASFDISLDTTLDISLISDTSSDGDSSFSFTLPPPSAPTYALEPRASSHADASCDTSFDTSLDISLISDTSTSSADESCDISFTLPSPPLGLGLGIADLYKHSGAPFDGMGVLSFGVRGAGASSAPSSSPSSCHSSSRIHAQTHTQAGNDTGLGLSRTFLEEAAWTWAQDPHHHGLGVIDEEWDEEAHVWAGAQEQDAGHVGDICGETDTCGSKSKSKSGSTSKSRTTTSRGVERDTISSGLKRFNSRPAPRSDAVRNASGAARSKVNALLKFAGVACSIKMSQKGKKRGGQDRQIIRTGDSNPRPLVSTRGWRTHRRYSAHHVRWQILKAWGRLESCMVDSFGVGTRRRGDRSISASAWLSLHYSTFNINTLAIPAHGCPLVESAPCAELGFRLLNLIFYCGRRGSKPRLECYHTQKLEARQSREKQLQGTRVAG